MESIKLIAIAASLTFLIIFFVTNQKLRDKINIILNKKFPKTFIKLKDFLVIISILVILISSICFLIYMRKTLEYTNIKIENQNNNL